jgi:hypothetical protein
MLVRCNQIHVIFGEFQSIQSYATLAAPRFVERWRADRGPGRLNQIAYRVFLEPGAFIMERKMLLGIKQRAEELAGKSNNGVKNQWIA